MNKNVRRLISLLTSFAISIGAIPAIAAAADNGETEEWDTVREIIGQYSGNWTSPPTNVVTSNMTSGPILGNGDLGVVMGGDENSQTYYISKSDFWAMTDDSNSDGTPKAIGGLNIINAGSGSSECDYSAQQNILDAVVTCQMPFDGNPIYTEAIVGAQSNDLVIEITPLEADKDIEVTVELWSKSDNSASGYVTGAGVDGDNVWVTRRTPERTRGESYAAVCAHIVGGENISTSTDGVSISAVTFTIPAGGSATITAAVDGGRENTDCLDNVCARTAQTDSDAVENIRETTAAWWKDYWLKEYVELDDIVLEEYYYGSLYQMGAASRAGNVAPGLFGIWTTTDSPSWGGDYTLDYNYYGPYNGMASSNRLEQFGSYFQPVLDFMEEGKKAAQEVTSVNGVSYPDGMPGVKYPTHIGPWGMETYFDCGMKAHAVFAAIPFIWYYNYTRDTEYLRDTAYPYLIEVANFWDEYLQLDEDGRYVVYDSSARESWSGSNDINPVLDLAFVRTLYTNIIPMSEALGVDEDRREKWQDILDNLSPLPTMEYNGKTVFREAENRDEISTYGLGDNPVNMQGIFPGDNVGLDSDEELLQTALNSLEVMNSWNQGNAFANIFVMAARVGWPAKDLINKMKLRISAIKQPNLTYQSDGHGLEGAGVLEAINSMLLQSHENVLRFFPVWTSSKDASFVRMRAVGAFLVNGEIKSGVVQPVTVYSEQGESCTVENPWSDRTLCVTASDGEEVEVTFDGKYYTFATEVGEEYTLFPLEGLPEPDYEDDDNEYTEATTEPMSVPDIAWWKLNGTAEDYTENGSDGSIYGAVLTDGRLDGALSFDGTDDYVFIEDYNKPSTFATYSAWVKADSLNTWGTILKNWGENTTGQIQLGLESDSGCLSVHVTQSNGTEVSCTEQTVFPTGTWEHVAVVADGTNIHLYHNGTETASVNYNGSLKTSFAPLGIGVKPNDAGSGAASSAASPGYWCGAIDDVRIYSAALSSEEIGILAQFKRYNSVYSEDFEASSVLTDVMSGNYGWSLGGSSEERAVQRGDNLGISSNALRFGAGDTWGQNMWLSLDFHDAAVLKLLDEDVDYDYAEQIANENLSGDVQLSFKAYFSCGDEDGRGAQYLIKLKDADYVPFAVIKVTPSRTAENVTLSLIALNADMTENVEYTIFQGKENVMDREMTFKVDINTSDNTYKLNIDGQDIETAHGVWIPASDSASVGAASAHTFAEIGIRQIDYVIENSGWWHTVTLDNIKILKSSAGIAETSITSFAADANNLTVDTSIVNISDENTELDVFYAAYNADGTLVGIKKNTIALDPSGAAADSADIICGEKPSFVKVFTWCGTMKPAASYYSTCEVG